MDWVAPHHGILTYTVGNEVEMDEKYTPYNHKGTKIDGVEPKHRGTPATKRGLSNQQICIITAIQRFTHTIAIKKAHQII